ncbi:MAG TPA: helix-turn-helix domain-containing protein, partial [Anaerolineales bacterium]
MSETIGKRLREAREARHLSLEKAAEFTRIRPHQLQALEADDYSLIPSAAQARGFLRNYAAYLGLDLGQALADVQRSRPALVDEVSGPLPQVDMLPDMPRTALASAETEIPAPPEPRPRPPSWLARFRGAVPPPESDAAPTDAPATAHPPAEPVAEEVAAPAVDAEPAEVESPPEAGDQLKVPVGAQRRSRAIELWSRLVSTFQVRLRKNVPAEESTAVGPDEESAGAPIASSATRPVETPEQIFVAIGAGLRQRRELLSLTLEEVERHLRLRSAFIKALEAGAFDKLPSAVQTRGMLANYAAFLDLDTDAILLRFADAIQAGHRLRYPEKPGGSKSPMRTSPNLPPLRSFIAGDLIFGVSMAALLVTMAVWGLSRVFTT